MTEKFNSIIPIYFFSNVYLDGIITNQSELAKIFKIIINNIKIGQDNELKLKFNENFVQEYFEYISNITKNLQQQTSQLFIELEKSILSEKFTQ